MSDSILSLVIFLPLIGALLVSLVPRHSTETVRRISFLTTLVTFLISLYLYFNFDSSTDAYQFIVQKNWIKSLGITYYLGLDGISLFLILLTTFLGPLTIALIYIALGNDFPGTKPGFTILAMIGQLIFKRPRYFSRKPVSELPFQR